MTESDDDEPYLIPEEELSVTHRATALTELRAQGCHHSALGYNVGFDSYYCETCDLWAEPACADEHCGYCRRRPSAPSRVHHD